MQPRYAPDSRRQRGSEPPASSEAEKQEVSRRDARAHEESKTGQGRTFPFGKREHLGAEQDIEANSAGQQEARNGKDLRPPMVSPEGVRRA